MFSMYVELNELLKYLTPDNQEALRKGMADHFCNASTWIAEVIGDPMSLRVAWDIQ